MARRNKAPSNRRAEKAGGVIANIVIRNRHRNSPTQVPEIEVQGVKTEEEEVVLSDIKTPVVTSLLDLSLILSLVFGGCCSNVYTYEYLLNMDSQLGTALTFSQMAFITAISLPSFVVIKWYSPHSLILRYIPIPSLKPSLVPLSQWVFQVVVLTAGSLLNNWAFAYHVPLTIQIVFRSAGLAVSMIFGWYMGKHYSLPQMASVFAVTLGVIIATTSGHRPSTPVFRDEHYVTEYVMGILMLTASLFCTGLLGLLQENAYTTYRPSWREGIFYTHALSLPIFLPFIPHIQRGYATLAQSASKNSFNTPIFRSQHILGQLPPSVAKLILPLAPYLMLLANLITQSVCVSGVNQLTSRVSSVSTNLVLTTRKAISLLFSVWWFGNNWNAQLGWGTGMVFAGSIVYAALASNASKKPSATLPPPPSPSSPSQSPSQSPSPYSSPSPVLPPPPPPKVKSRSNTPRPRKASGTPRSGHKRTIKKEE